MHIDDVMHGISTLIKSTYTFGASQGTGFFYQEPGEKDATKNEQWIKIENTYLVTNRHVVLATLNGKEQIPTSFTFHLRRKDNGKIIWEPITLKTDELLERALFHKDNNVDVCIIDVFDLITDKIKKDESYLNWSAVSKGHFPGENKINIDVASNAVVIGYPRGFYDELHKFPIVKSGIIASRYGLPFNGEPYFLIDSKLFPGSSGSVVISEPTNIVVNDGQVYHNKEKQFAFLGIYSGEPFQQNDPIELEDMTIIRKSGFNVGIVWYGYLIEEIIENGHKL